jgi:uncharacterized UPF0160 family protein
MTFDKWVKSETGLPAIAYSEYVLKAWNAARRTDQVKQKLYKALKELVDASENGGELYRGLVARMNAAVILKLYEKEQKDET